VKVILPPDYPYPLHTGRAEQSGISFARNAATDLALSLDPEFVAYLDDDEWPSRVWLTELHRIQASTDADVVGGPTHSAFPQDVDPQLTLNPYYGADLRLADGAACQLQAAGNFLIRTAVLKSLAPLFFHPAFAHSGGEDLAFFTQLSQRGARMHWAAGAVVHESVPANRLTESWMKTRIINIANSRVRVMQLLQPGIGAALLRGSKTAALFSVALLASLAALVNKRLLSKAQMLRWKFWGKFTAHLRIATSREDGH